MQQDLLLYVITALIAGAFIGFFLGYAVRASISWRRRKRAMMNRGWL
jgi:NhaP-type Na+/H+ or K+/H+ antiporter